MKYDYICTDCKETFEISAPIEVYISSKFKCPHCGSENTKRKYTPIGMILRGMGFYSTDNRKDNKDNIESE